MLDNRPAPRTLKQLSILILTLSFSLLALTLPGLVYAANITVNTTADELNSDGDCSLREAIQAANTDAPSDGCTAGSGADTISFNPSLTSGGDVTITLTIFDTGLD